MPNHCSCSVRLGADPQQIQMLHDAEFSFEKLYPCLSENKEDWYEWQIEHWGTKWDRFDYKLELKGDAGLQLKFTTAWEPPTKFFKYLAEKYHDMWIRCDWIEEGGYAGVYIVHWNEDEKKIEEVDASWADWCLEEWAYRMGNKEQTTLMKSERVSPAPSDDD